MLLLMHFYVLSTVLIADLLETIFVNKSYIQKSILRDNFLEVRARQRPSNAAFKKRLRLSRAAPSLRIRFGRRRQTVAFHKLIGAKHQICPCRPAQSLPFEAPDSPGAEPEVYPLFPAVPPPCLLLVPCRPEATSS